MTAGSIQKWQIKVGDKLSTGDVLGEIETDKAPMSFDISEEGYVARILVEAGTPDVPVGKPILVVCEDAASVGAFKDIPLTNFLGAAAVPIPPPAAPAAEAPAPAAASVATAAPVSAPAAAANSAASHIIASPLAKRLAAAAQVSLQGVTGTGTNNRITKADVDALVQAKAPAAPAPAAPAASPAPAQTSGAFVDLPLTNMRKVIAARLLQSKQSIPHFYLTVDVQVDEVMQLRAKLNNAADGKFKLSLNDFVIKASALALRAIPQANSSWHDTFIRQHAAADISVAVATDSGLITPIVFGADSKGLSSIANNVKELAEKARTNKLAPHEYQGGTFTISNLGMFGVKSFSAIINPPQSCILAVGSVEKTLVPDEAAPGQTRAASIMSVTLSCDHRVVDGAVGARWLSAFKKYLETPTTMLL